VTDFEYNSRKKLDTLNRLKRGLSNCRIVYTLFLCNKLFKFEGEGNIVS